MEKENKQKICDLLCTTLRETRALGSDGNPLVALQYIKLDGSEIVRPMFQDGTGANGYYDINVTCDSGAALITDVVAQFVARRM